MRQVIGLIAMLALAIASHAIAPNASAHDLTPQTCAEDDYATFHAAIEADPDGDGFACIHSDVVRVNEMVFAEAFVFARYMVVFPSGEIAYTHTFACVDFDRRVNTLAPQPILPTDYCLQTAERTGARLWTAEAMIDAFVKICMWNGANTCNADHTENAFNSVRAILDDGGSSFGILFEDLSYLAFQPFDRSYYD